MLMVYLLTGTWMKLISSPLHYIMLFCITEVSSSTYMNALLLIMKDETFQRHVLKEGGLIILLLKDSLRRGLGSWVWLATLEEEEEV